MTSPATLQKLLTWLSPAFPVGAFAWSAGLETAIADRRIRDAAALQNWIEGSLSHGGAKTDAIILSHAWRAVGDPFPSAGATGRRTAEEEPATNAAASAALTDLADLVIALTPSAERHRETLLTGDSFVTAGKAWPSDIYATLPSPCPYPVAVGAIASAHGIGLEETLLAYLTAAVHAQVSVAVRLVPLGQADGLKVMATLEPPIAALAKAAATASLADIGGIAYAADIAQMRHETLEPRIFRS